MQTNGVRNGLVFGIIILMVGTSLVSAVNENQSTRPKSMDRSTWLYVGGGGPGNYTTIQSAVDAANPGDSIYIYAGTYVENILLTKDNIRLSGEDKAMTIIDANGQSDAIFVQHHSYDFIENVTIRDAGLNGFHISESGGSGSQSCHNTLLNCIIENNVENGVFIESHVSMSDAGFLSVISCIIHDNGNGVKSYLTDGAANHILITNCSIYNNTYWGVYIGDYDGSRYAQIVNSDIYQNGDGGVRTCFINSVENCQIHHNIGNGIYALWFTNITSCHIYNNTQNGIDTGHGDHNGGNLITGNTIDNNGAYGILSRGFSYQSQIYTNNLVDNIVNALDTGLNACWYNINSNKGNYWSDYSGSDMDGDGIGDSPYFIELGNQDQYPIMYPNGWIPPSYVWVDDGFNQSTPGWGYDHFSNIQAGVDAVNENGTVFVFSGTYNENVMMPKNNITLKGENKNTTTINADETAMAAIYVDTFHSTTISGFTLHCPLMPGIYFRDSNNNMIFDCILSNCTYGAVIYTEHTGMNNTVMNCNIYNNNMSGILITGAADNYYLNQSNVFNCSIHNNRNGILVSGRPDWSGIINNTVISGCNIFNNTDKGIYINLLLGKILRVTIYHNNIINNTGNAYDNAANIWYNITLHEGNYWSDYMGQDNEGDGIGDTPYNISGGGNQDLYPFMKPNGWLNEQPIANFSFLVDELSVTFNASSSYDPDGNISSWLWNFGDETEGAGEIVSHEYLTSGTYNVTLTVKDDAGAEDSITHEIMVEKFQMAFFFGRITNFSTLGKYISFEAVKTRVMTFVPFSFNTYIHGERFTISKEYHGMVGLRYILALCNILI